MLSNLPSNGVDFLSHGGPARELIRSIDWSQTAIGEPKTWPQSLRSALSICFNSNFPIAIYWGPELVLMYNEAWSPIPGNKHPWAFGKPAMKVWPEIWSDIEPQFKKAFSGVPGGSRDALLPMQRHGYTEECYFDFTFTPVYGESGMVEGIFNAVIETTYRVINERRGAILQRLGEAINGVATEQEVFRKAGDVLEEADKDISFFCIYEFAAGQLHPRAQSKSIEGTGMHAWPFEEMMSAGSSKLITDLQAHFDKVPTQHWAEQPVEALTVPLKSNDGNILGFVIGGLSARRRSDKEYRGFIESIANTISGELNTLRSLARERERAESLAQIDRAKTAFFSNISHEFRTPLTLMTSPLEEVLNMADSLQHGQRENLEASLRNALRLQKLVNSLLDFSKIEAGKLEASLQWVDINQLTRDFASSFRSVIESAGIAYQVDIQSQVWLILIDPDMWEKIVLNLISNAFKYTERGSITVALHAIESNITLKVSDTGMGIAGEHVGRIFERFYRVSNEGGRSQEGTGIGLSLVKELVMLHKGDITVESKLGQGTTFTVSLPVTVGEQMPHSSGSTVHRSGTQKAFVEEASKWNHTTQPIKAAGQTDSRPTVLVADDNGDMRDYIERILSNDFETQTVNNGEDAFTLALERVPDLILTDIMMPKLNGFGLLKKLKSNLTTKNIPVIFLSARAGEESKVEGIQLGADDYLIKPFSARELLARVGNTIAINKARLDTEKEFFRLFLQLPAHIHLFSGPDHLVEFFHPLGRRFIGRDIQGQKIREALPELAGQGYFELLDKVYHTGDTVSMPANKAILPGEDGQPEELYFSITYLPWRDGNGNIRGVLQFTLDVTEQTKANLKIKESEERFRVLANSIPLFVWIADEAGNVEFISNQWEKYTNVSVDEGREKFSSLIHDEDVGQVRTLWAEALSNGTAWTSEFRLKNGDGGYTWFFGHTVPLKDDEGRIVKWVGSASDITQQKNLHFQLEEIVAERTNELLALNKILYQRNEELAKAQIFLQTVLDASVELVTAFDTRLNFTFVNKRLFTISGTKPEQLIGKNLVDVAPGIDQTDGYQYLMRALAGEIVHIPSKRSQIDDKLIFETFVIPLKHHGNVTGVVSMQRDITSLVNLSERLSKSNDQLKRSNEDLQQFAHVTSHDLKEPVRKIKMYGNILGTEYANYLPDKGKDYLAKIDKATTRISAMIDGVLRYATVDVAEQSWQRIDLNETIKSITEDLEIPIKEFKAQLEYESLPVIRGYPTLIYQLFYNLINNSLKFRRKEVAPRIKITYLPADEEIASEDAGLYFRIELEDNGVGFEQAYAEKIFESFTRLYPKDAYEGTGLGLALCRKIVVRHGGTIKAESELNNGAKFILSFPKSILL